MLGVITLFGGWGKKLNILDCTLVFTILKILKEIKKIKRLESSFSVNLFKDGRCCFF